MRRRNALLAASFVAIVSGCKKNKSVTDVWTRTVVRDGRCVRISECYFVMRYKDDPICDKPVPPPQVVDCPLGETARLADGSCYYPHPLKSSGVETLPMGNPPPQPAPARVLCPPGVKDYDPGPLPKAKAAASASGSASK